MCFLLGLNQLSTEECHLLGRGECLWLVEPLNEIYGLTNQPTNSSSSAYAHPLPLLLVALSPLDLTSTHSPKLLSLCVRFTYSSLFWDMHFLLRVPSHPRSRAPGVTSPPMEYSENITFKWLTFSCHLVKDDPVPSLGVLLSPQQPLLSSQDTL